MELNYGIKLWNYLKENWESLKNYIISVLKTFSLIFSIQAFIFELHKKTQTVEKDSNNNFVR